MNKNERSAKLKAIFTEGAAVKIIFTAFLLVSFLSLILGGGDYTDIAFVQGDMSFLLAALFLLGIIVFSSALAAAEVFAGQYKPVQWTMLVSALLFSTALVANGDNGTRYHLYAAIIAVFAIIVNCVVNDGALDIIPNFFDKRIRWGIVGAVAAVACFAVAAIGVYRYASYSAPNFDFGIWCNMFHNMSESGLPNTTCERDGLLSHFAVHFSPIYYLMLPFYMLFPHPATLQILQAVILYSGVVPLCILAKDKGLSDRAAAALGLIYAFYPAIATGTFYDLHENCFLLPLLLWCFCFFEKEKYIPMAVFAGMTLLVKEDAFIYVLIFALYVFFLKKKKKTALALALAALVYFVAVSSLMKAFGNGIMTSRYENLIFNADDGLVGVIKTALLNPGYLLTQLFVSKDGDNAKILYIFQLLLPLSFLPVVTKKISRYILVVPVLMNVITMYVYQPNINFQYSFGIIAFLFYVTVLNLGELGDKTRKFMLSLSAVAAFLLFAMLVCGNLGYYKARYDNNREVFEKMNYALEEMLPDDASVACTAFILPHIADRDEVYEVKYHKEKGKYKTDTDYAVFDMRYASENEEAIKAFRTDGYEEYYSDEGIILILKKK